MDAFLFTFLMWSIMVITPVLLLVLLFGWLWDIRTETRRITKMLKKHFPEDFDDGE